MTAPVPTDIPPVDLANRYALANKHPVDLVTNDIPSPIGKLAVVTTRTAGSTNTVLLTAEELDTWIKVLQERRDLMTGLTVIRNGHSPLAGGPQG